MATPSDRPTRVSEPLVASSQEMVGRTSELCSLHSMLEATRDGRGGLALVCGEAGIGKSHLVGHVAARAVELGLLALWGRGWESGGAPAFWPWIQVLRDLLEAQDPDEAVVTLGDGAGDVAELLPALREAFSVPSRPPLEPAQARFRLLDAVASYLRRAAARRPLLLILEDLHAADASTLDLLGFLARGLSESRLALIGTFRPVEARAAGVADAIARAARSFATYRLEPLTPDEVRELVEEVRGRPSTEEGTARVVAASEGNPLFATELARLDPGDGNLAAVPEGIGALIRERTLRLPPDTTDTLRRMSVAGRDFSLSRATALIEAEPEELATLLEPAVEAGLLAAEDGARYRFAHILVRETLHGDLPPRERGRLHLRLARALDERRGQDPTVPLSEIAHHYVESGAAGAAEAVTSSVRAAERSLVVLAYHDAAEHYRRALAALEIIEPDAATRRAALLLSLGRSRLLAGHTEDGRRSCREAAEIARAIGSVELLARAALEHGSTFAFAKVDAELVGLLEEALAALGEGHRDLRALLMARLAAARQPALDPTGPIALAHEAISVARELGDERTLLAVLRSAVSALMDFEHPRTREALNREHVELARRLGEPVEVLRGHARLVIDFVELGDVTRADEAIEAYADLARAVDHPSYEWQAFAFRAMRAAMSGQFAAARAYRDRARSLGARSGDGNALRCLDYQGMGLARATYDEQAIRSILDHSLELGVPLIRNLMLAATHAILEEPDRVRALRANLDPVTLAGTMDCHVLGMAAEIAAAGEDEQGALTLYAALEKHADHNLSWGMTCVYCEGPVELQLGMLAWTLGRSADADAHFERAAARAERMGLAPYSARALYEHGRRLASREETRERGHDLLRRAAALASQLGMTGLEERAARVLGVCPPAGGTVAVEAQVQSDDVRMMRQADVWVLGFRGIDVHVKASRGQEILARLVAEPGREFHVLDLVSPGGAVDAGDAGEHLDAEAQAAYRERARALREEIDEAERWNDPGRVDRARTELDALAAELARATGLGGRGRRAAAAAERARVSVQKRVRDALRRIETVHPALARYLSWTVRTGAFCVYEPPGLKGALE